MAIIFQTFHIAFCNYTIPHKYIYTIIACFKNLVYQLALNKYNNFIQ